jgi:hypothetical protein
MRVLRDRPGDIRLRLPCITRLLQLRTVIHRPVGPTGLYIYCAPLLVGYPPTSPFDGFDRARVFYFGLIFLLLLFLLWFDFNSNWVIRIPYLSVFSVGGHIRVWILLRFIILFYFASLFEISVCPKGFLFWPLIGTEKVRTLLWPLVGIESLIFVLYSILSFYE